MLEGRLESEGYDVKSVEGGIPAVEALAFPADDQSENQDNGEEHERIDHFDLVLLDIRMPDMDGYQVLDHIRKNRSPIELPVIMVTSVEDVPDIVHALNLGANDYVTKPFDMTIILARVATHLDLKRSHQALKEAQQSIVWAAKMESISYLASGVAHEIKNPLAHIQMGIDTLRNLRRKRFKDASEEEPDDSDAHVYSIMESAIEKAATIVNGLMDFSSKSRIAVEPHDLNSLLKESLDKIEDKAKASEVVIETEFDSTIPDALIDKPQFMHVVNNLMQNALQAMPDGGVIRVGTSTRVVRHRAADEGSRRGNRLRNGDTAVCLEITDDGPGITDENMPRIFDAFFTTRAAGQGTGLGLTIAKKVVDLHDGVIAVEKPESGNGVTFSVFLRPAMSLMGAV